LALTYTCQGRLARITDSEGESTLYTYDPAGEHLLAVQFDGGSTVHYTYAAGAGAAREHALTSIQGPSGVTRTFTYDSAGRLASTFLADNSERVDYFFDSTAVVTARDAVGSTKVFFD